MRWARALLGCSAGAVLMLVFRHRGRRRQEGAERSSPRPVPPPSVADEAERWLASRDLGR